MDGVFMKKIGKLLVICIWMAACLYMGTVLSDRRTLSEDVIRLHVVAASDSREDQSLKLKVRDAVTSFLQEKLQDLPSAEEAKKAIEGELGELESLVNGLLSREGVSHRAKVTLQKEAFDTRFYESFTMPAGVYDALRITIGPGEGRNWWCVVFPSLCLPAAGEDFEDTAAGAGFQTSLTGALEGEPQYEVRFFLLDLLGRIENFFHNLG